MMVSINMMVIHLQNTSLTLLIPIPCLKILFIQSLRIKIITYGSQLDSRGSDRGKIEIRVKDNGTGVSQKVSDKIFQPFFTTKPAGEGTGLGLSLSYDIIKAHGGEIKLQAKENEGAEFIIELPV